MKGLNIYKRKDGRFEGRITTEIIDGKRKFKAFFGKTEEDVLSKMEKFKASLTQPTEKHLTLSSVFTEWFQSISYRVKASTLANYLLKSNKHIIPAFGKQNIAEIAQTSIYQFIRDKQNSGLSNRYITDILILMKSVFKYAARTYHVINPMEGIFMPKKQKAEIRLLTEAEEQKLMQIVMGNQNLTTLGIALAKLTGLRIGEFCSLQWEDIDLEKRILTVKKTLQRIQVKGSSKKTKLVITEPKSETSKRSIPIPECIIGFLRKFQGKADEYLLSGSENENFANAREMRNILEQVVMCQNLRSAGTKEKMLEIVDVNRYIKDSGLVLPVSSRSSILTNEERLDQLVGLASVKRMVKKIKAYAKRNQSSDDFNMHMCFYGNPGTGKTEVARIISGLLYDAGVLPEAKLVETDASGLIGKYVGETAPKTQAKINDAMGGVLFIDEAYALTETSGADGVSSGYGDEAISVLLKEMEDKRGKFCVILAGYKEQMQKLLSSNPGFASRIQFSLDFPDYSREELMQLADVFLSKKQYEIDSDAMEKLLDVTEYFRQNDDFANARTLRNILDQVIMNQNLRAEDDEEDRTII